MQNILTLFKICYLSFFSFLNQIGFTLILLSLRFFFKFCILIHKESIFIYAVIQGSNFFCSLYPVIFVSFYWFIMLFITFQIFTCVYVSPGFYFVQLVLPVPVQKPWAFIYCNFVIYLERRWKRSFIFFYVACSPTLFLALSSSMVNLVSVCQILQKKRILLTLRDLCVSNLVFISLNMCLCIYVF